MEVQRMKSIKKVKQGKKSRAQGNAFEARVRVDLEEKGWIADRWSNNVEFKQEPKENEIDFEDYGDVSGMEVLEGKNIPKGNRKINIGKLIPAKVSWRRTPHGMFPMGLNSGFPDFICFRKIEGCYVNEMINDKFPQVIPAYEIIGVESKLTGTLDTEEKLKCQWLLDNNIFSRILVARKTKVKNKIVVEYEDFTEIEKRMKKISKNVNNASLGGEK